mgnify:CR=1 FL=1
MNIAEILKKCPEGTELYSPIFGEVKFSEIQPDDMIVVIIKNNRKKVFFKDGSYSEYGECVLFPSKKQLDWIKFIVSDPSHQLKPFDKVLVRDSDNCNWVCDIFSHLEEKEGCIFACIGTWWRQCIPYEGNEHLLGTTNKPE